MVLSYLNYFFIAGRTVKPVKTAHNVTEITNPIKLATNVTLTVVKCCCPPQVQLTAECVSVVALLSSMTLSPPNPYTPVTFENSVHLVTSIYDRYVS